MDKKRVPNNGIVPKYYVEGSHDAIIDKDTFLRVQAELARRSSIKTGEKKRTYSSKYALSSRVFCAYCGDIYRRIAWNNRGYRSIVWRCVSRVEKKKSRIDCPARTLREERQSILTEAALKHDLQDRIEDLIAFLDEQTEAITEYSEPLARRLIEKVTVYDEKLVVEFKSGLQINVEA